MPLEGNRTARRIYRTDRYWVALKVSYLFLERDFRGGLGSENCIYTTVFRLDDDYLGTLNDGYAHFGLTMWDGVTWEKLSNEEIISIRMEEALDVRSPQTGL